MCTVTIKNRNHNKMITKKDTARSSLTMLPVNYKPSDNDVLCGRGNVFSNHYGNQFFGKLIRENISEYKEATSRPDKVNVVDSILDEIRDSGARFTKVDTETERWYELNDVQAHQKIGHAIRDTIRILGKENSSNSNSKNKKIAIRRSRTIKSSVANKKKMLFQQKRKSRITIQQRREQQKQLVLSSSSYSSSSSSSSLLSSDIDDILEISLDNIEFLDDILVGDSVLKKQQQQQENEYYHHRNSSSSSYATPFTSTSTFKFKLLEGGYNINNNKQQSFLLENEFPEQQFSFNANQFF